ncbi:sensor histidine kinase [Pseudonocardia humida]|uniref:histidine kinase n=1 Tax=Pseudonocardia humida TaxID=2800819 RepID=A0ABT0ZSW0_9PSEU|nr:histidine kinase [Pseudonocardia humida]MCO1653809.1 hypothetical protein [Pseudonocardia humida]
MTADLAPRALSGRSARVVGRFGASRPGRATWVLLWAAALAAEFGALVPVLFGDGTVEAIDVVFRTIGGSFAVCGLIAWHRRPDNRSGQLMTATGFAFFVSPLVSQLDSAPATTIGLWLPDLWMVFFVPLLLSYLSGGRLRTVLDRVLVGVVAFEVFVLAPLWLAFYPAEGNLLLVVADPGLAHAVESAQLATLLAGAVGTAAVIAARWRAATPPRRRAMLPSAAGAVCLLLLAALLAVDLVAERSPVLVWIGICSIAAVPIAFLAGLLRSALARGGLIELFSGLRTARPAELRAALAKALGDPALLIAYPQPDGRSYSDTDGRAVVLSEPGGERSVTRVVRDGQPIAVLVYDRSLDDDPELVEAVGAAATIALENSHLQAQTEAQLAALAAARERIITAGDAERRRIERNLHDGAQQRLVTLALQLSLIQRRIRTDPDDAEQLVTEAGDELARSLAELRELARGIHPAALDHGLDVALEALAMRAAVPTTVTVEPGPRLGEPVALAAYFVVSEALANTAKYAGASAAQVRVTRREGQAIVEITDDGVGGADPGRGSGLRGLADRVESLGGSFEVGGGPTGGTVVRAHLPIEV